MDKYILEQLISHSESQKVYSELSLSIKKILIPLINRTVLQRLGLMSEFGIGKVGYSLSQENLFYKLIFFYDAGDDVFLIKYKQCNNIINDLEIEIIVEKDAFPHLITSSMEEYGRAHFKTNSNLS